MGRPSDSGLRDQGRPYPAVENNDGASSNKAGDVAGPDGIWNLMCSAHTRHARPSAMTARVSGTFHSTDVIVLLKMLKLLCIQSEYDKAAQRITLTNAPGKAIGARCQ